MVPFFVWVVLRRCKLPLARMRRDMAASQSGMLGLISVKILWTWASVRAGLKMVDVPSAPDWPTLGAFAKKLGKGATSTPYQRFLKTFLYGRWREYSALAHATFEGLSDCFLRKTQFPLIAGTKLMKRILKLCPRI